VKKILLVDDNQYLHELMGKVITFMGHEMIGAVIATEGLQKAIAEKPDLIVLDIDLPDMDGRDAARLLRSNPATRGIPILAFTGMPNRLDGKSLFDAGCDDYVQKPVSQKVLREKLQGLLDPTKH
jgi:two-component system cell cycle response regulator DivK